MASRLVALFCVFSLASAQLVFDRNINKFGGIKLINADSGIRNVGYGYNMAPASSAWTVGSGRTFHLGSSPALFDSGLQSKQVYLKGGTGYGTAGYGTGLSAFTLGGIPSSHQGLAVLSLAGAPQTQQYTTLLDNQAIQDTGAIQLVQQESPVQIIEARKADDSILFNRDLGLNLAVGRAAVDVAQPVTAAVTSIGRKIEYIPMAYSGQPASTQLVNVPPNEQGLHINFVSKSSPLTVSQQHIPGEPGQVHVTESQDEPQRLVHNVKKAVIQELNEVVQPVRVLKTEVRPVLEQAHLQVAQGENIPLSGQRSGIITTEGAGMGQTFGVSSIGANVAQPVAIVSGRANNLNTISLADQGLAGRTVFAAAPAASNVALVQPALTRVAIAQPKIQTVAFSQPKFQTVGFASHPTMQTFGRSFGSLGGTVSGIKLANANLGQGQVSILDAPVSRKFAFTKQQNIGWAHPSTLETNKFIYNQPATAFSSFGISKFAQQPQELQAKIMRY